MGISPPAVRRKASRRTTARTWSDAVRRRPTFSRLPARHHQHDRQNWSRLLPISSDKGELKKITVLFQNLSELLMPTRNV
ncbi:hypothetical protein J6590_031962 [Homalodisca vitripennis]|nr:hypothetical protein J6590_031962 [Homalodisca vitripennis]